MSRWMMIAGGVICLFASLLGFRRFILVSSSKWDMGRPIKWFWHGALIGIVGTFPMAAICALLFRFPIPFGGYLSGLEAVMPALLAVAFYGAVGGFVVQALLGGLGGLVASRIESPSSLAPDRRCIVFSLVAASLGVLTLALLDRIIGPW